MRLEILSIMIAIISVVFTMLRFYSISKKQEGAFTNEVKCLNNELHSLKKKVNKLEDDAKADLKDLNMMMAEDIKNLGNKIDTNFNVQNKAIADMQKSFNETLANLIISIKQN